MNTHCHTRHCTCHMLEVKLIQTFTASTTLPSFKEYNNIWMTDFSWHRHENGMSGVSAQPSFLQTVTVLFTFSVFRLSPQTFTCSCFLFSDSAHRPLPVHVFCLQTQPHVLCQDATVLSVSSSLTSRPAPGMKSVQSCSCFQHSSPVPCSHRHIQWN